MYRGIYMRMQISRVERKDLPDRRGIRKAGEKIEEKIERKVAKARGV
jgi:hypothetical protein